MTNKHGACHCLEARTITLGEVIGAKVYKPVRKLEPAIESVIPEVPVVDRIGGCLMVM